MSLKASFCQGWLAILMTDAARLTKLAAVHMLFQSHVHVAQVIEYRTQTSRPYTHINLVTRARGAGHLVPHKKVATLYAHQSNYTCT